MLLSGFPGEQDVPPRNAETSAKTGIICLTVFFLPIYVRKTWTAALLHKSRQHHGPALEGNRYFIYLFFFFFKFKAVKRPVFTLRIQKPPDCGPYHTHARSVDSTVAAFSKDDFFFSPLNWFHILTFPFGRVTSSPSNIAVIIRRDVAAIIIWCVHNTFPDPFAYKIHLYLFLYFILHYYLLYIIPIYDFRSFNKTTQTKNDP